MISFPKKIFLIFTATATMVSVNAVNLRGSVSIAPSSSASTSQPSLFPTSFPDLSLSGSPSSSPSDILSGCNLHNKVVSYLTSNLHCEYSSATVLKCDKGSYVDEYGTNVSSYWNYHMKNDGSPYGIALETRHNDRFHGSTIQPFSNDCSENDMQMVYDRVPPKILADNNQRNLLDKNDSVVPSSSPTPFSENFPFWGSSYGI